MSEFVDNNTGNESILTNGWLTQPLGILASQITKGTTPTTAGHSYKDSGIPFIKVENIDKHGINISSVSQFIDGRAHEDLKRSQFAVNDVLFSIAGTIGKTALVTEDLVPANTNQAVAIIRGVSEFFIPNFLRLQLKESAEKIAKSNARGGAMNNISLGDLKAVAVMLPPLAEQKVIADELDELLAQVESTKARLDAIPAILKSFRQSVLAAAVSGKLTEEWRGENDSLKSASISEIEELWISRYTTLGKKFKTPKVTPIQDELTNLPRSWLWTQIGLVCDVYVGATPSRKKEAFWNGNINWVSSSEVAFCRINETKEAITDEGLKGTSTNIHPKGTVMLAMIGQGKTRGQPAILDIEACHNQNTAAIRVLDSHCLSEYLYYFLYERYEETRRVGSGNNQQAMNKTVVQSLAFSLPPIEEQTIIVRRVEELFAFADKVEAQVNAAQLRVNNLTQSILAKAFRGELTQEWRAENQDLISGDNSAEALLKRIKAERETLTKTTKKSAKKASTKKVSA